METFELTKQKILRDRKALISRRKALISRVAIVSASGLVGAGFGYLLGDLVTVVIVACTVAFLAKVLTDKDAADE